MSRRVDGTIARDATSGSVAPRRERLRRAGLANPHGYYSIANRGSVRARDFDAVVKIDPKPGEAEVRCELVLEPGLSVRGRLVDPDGRPVIGVTAFGLSATAGAASRGRRRFSMAPEFTAIGLDPDHPRLRLVPQPAAHPRAHGDALGLGRPRADHRHAPAVRHRSSAGCSTPRADPSPMSRSSPSSSMNSSVGGYGVDPGADRRQRPVPHHGPAAGPHLSPRRLEFSRQGRIRETSPSASARSRTWATCGIESLRPGSSVLPEPCDESRPGIARGIVLAWRASVSAILLC